MIKIENQEVVGWEHAIRGMRNPMNSWDKLDTVMSLELRHENKRPQIYANIGNNDLDLMTRLVKAGTDHRKFMRMIVVYADITAPLYWWKEYDTYKVGTVANSCSTMHKIHEKEFTLEDFSHEHLDDNSLGVLEYIIANLNECRNIYINGYKCDFYEVKPKNKEYWWQMIQLLPSSYNQKRTVMMNYEVLKNMYHSRKAHKLDEWRTFCDFIKELPYAKELICNE